MKREELKSMFDALRNDPQHHLGLGDIRLTVAQQDLILDAIDASLPPAEGAEENIIYHNLTQPFRQILQSVALHGYDIVFAERDCVKCATEFAALHSQRLAEKMVEERMEQYKAQFKDRPNPRDVNPYDSKGIKRICNRKIR